jgi:hypothetical protein
MGEPELNGGIANGLRFSVHPLQLALAFNIPVRRLLSSKRGQAGLKAEYK